MNALLPLDILERKFFDAFERGDIAALAECYGPDMRVWNNVQQIDLTGDEHIAQADATFFARSTDRRFVDVRTDFFNGGFVRQHVVTATMSGKPLRQPMCIVCRAKDGLLTRIDEYVNFE